jgi:hypothetical protein
MTKHAFASAKSDGADPTLVRPSDWNAEHVSAYAIGTLTIATGNYLVMAGCIKLTTTQVLTVAGTGQLRIV